MNILTLKENLYMMDSMTVPLPKAIFSFSVFLTAYRIEENFMRKLLLNSLEQTILPLFSSLWVHRQQWTLWLTGYIALFPFLYFLECSSSEIQNVLGIPYSPLQLPGTSPSMFYPHDILFLEFNFPAGQIEIHTNVWVLHEFHR